MGKPVRSETVWGSKTNVLQTLFSRLHLQGLLVGRGVEGEESSVLNASTLQGIDQGCQGLRRAAEKGERGSMSLPSSGLWDARVDVSNQELVTTPFLSLGRWKSRL